MDQSGNGHPFGLVIERDDRIGSWRRLIGIGVAFVVDHDRAAHAALRGQIGVGQKLVQGIGRAEGPMQGPADIALHQILGEDDLLTGEPGIFLK